MKLDTWKKEAFVRSVMDDIPQKSDDQIAIEIQDAVYKAMTPRIRKLYREFPAALKVAHISRPFKNTTRKIIVADVEFEPVIQPWVQAVDERGRARDKLRSAVFACSTSKALQKAFPEFIKYMPKEPAPSVNQVVVVNVVTDLVKLGWPKEGAQ